MANIKRLTFLLLFSRQEIHEKYTKNEGFQFSTGPAQARKQYVRTKTCFSFKIKDQIFLFELEGILKNHLRLFKTLLVYHSAIM